MQEGERRECLLDGGGAEVVRSRRERKREGLSNSGGEEMKRSLGGRKRVRGVGKDVVQSMSGSKGAGDVGEMGADI